MWGVVAEGALWEHSSTNKRGEGSSDGAESERGEDGHGEEGGGGEPIGESGDRARASKEVPGMRRNIVQPRKRCEQA